MICVLFKKRSGPGIAGGIKKVRDKIINTSSTHGRCLQLHLELHVGAERTIAEGISRVLELERDTIDDYSVNLIIITSLLLLLSLSLLSLSA
jgi:hypothetical protein